MNKELYDVGDLTNNPSLSLKQTDGKISLFQSSNGKEYFFKNEASWIIELLADKIASFYNIPAVKHRKAMYKGNIGVISESFHKEGFNYINGEQLITEYLETHPEVAKDYNNLDRANNLEVIWWALEHRYKNYPKREELIKKLMNQFVTLYEFGIMTGQTDLHLNNYQIEESQDDANLAPLFDNALSFMTIPVATLSIEQEDSFASSTESLKKYFSYVSREQGEEFINKVNSLSIEDVSLMLNDIIQNVNIVDEEKKYIDSEKSEIIRSFLINKKKILNAKSDFDKSRSL